MEGFGQESDSITRSQVVSFFGYILLFGGLFILWFAIQETQQAIEAKSLEERRAVLEKGIRPEVYGTPIGASILLALGVFLYRRLS